MGNICKCKTNEYEDDTLIIDNSRNEKLKLFLYYIKIKKKEKLSDFYVPIWTDKCVKLRNNFF